jgi:hypothetical protein
VSQSTNSKSVSKHLYSSASHLNSVEKSADGDYLISARHTDSVYKVSATNGSILWRLGGSKSSFVLDGFDFSAQHDARLQSENSSITTISLLDNAAASVRGYQTSSRSSALLIALHTSIHPMTVTLIQRWDRPDGRLSFRRGNVQILANSNVFVGRSASGYLS